MAQDLLDKGAMDHAPENHRAAIKAIARGEYMVVEAPKPVLVKHTVYLHRWRGQDSTFISEHQNHAQAISSGHASIRLGKIELEFEVPADKFED